MLTEKLEMPRKLILLLKTSDIQANKLTNRYMIIIYWQIS